MQRTATVRPGQSLPDIAVEHCGSAEAWAAIASLNSLGLTAALSAGQVLKLPDPTDKRVVAYFKNGGHHPAVGDVQVFIPQEGIGFWRIGIDFVVS